MISKHFHDIESYIYRHSRINFKTIFRLLEDDSLLIVLIILSVLNIILAPLPANSFVLGIPLMALSLAYTFKIDLGSKNYRWKRRSIKCEKMRQFLPHSHSIFDKLDKYVSPRYPFFIQSHFHVFAGLTLFFLALVIFLPIPFANVPGSIGMLLICVGLLQEDGLFVVIGYIMAALHLIGIILLAAMVGYGIN